MSRLDEYLPTRSFIDTQRFFIRGYTCEEGAAGPVVRYPADNIVGVLPGTGRVPGYYIISAHYDATALHSFPDPATEPPWFWWCENPAPGGDDNATGVAIVLEAARALSDLSFPFDIRFVLFSGEELGLHGSEAYADSAAGYRAGEGAFVAPPDTIFGVLNIDMVALQEQRRRSRHLPHSHQRRQRLARGLDHRHRGVALHGPLSRLRRSHDRRAARRTATTPRSGSTTTTPSSRSSTVRLAGGIPTTTRPATSRR